VLQIQFVASAAKKKQTIQIPKRGVPLFIAEKVVPSFRIGCNATVCNIFIEWDGTTFYVPVLSKVGTSSIATYPMVVWGYAVCTYQ
jgi:hypothetical protein